MVPFASSEMTKLATDRQAPHVSEEKYMRDDDDPMLTAGL